MHDYTGKLIALEGIDGAGTTTQLGRVVSRLAAQGKSVIASREPWPGASCHDKLREYMANTPADHLSWFNLAVMFAAARVEHVNELIIPHLQLGEIVVLDRYQCSTLAYQGATLRALGPDYVNRLAAIGPHPDVEILLDVDAEIGLQRRKVRPTEDCFEDSLVIQERVVREYRHLVGSRLVSVDGTCSEDEVTERIMAVLRWKGI